MANIPMKDIQFPGLDDTYTFAQVDATLTTQGKAADAKKTGDEISELKADLTAIETDIETGNLTAGTAKQLLSDTGMTDKSPYLFRAMPTGAGDREEPKIVGGSVVWNQLQKSPSEGGTYSYQSAGSISYDGDTVINTAVSATAIDIRNREIITFQKNHKYVFSYDVKCSEAVSIKAYFKYALKSTIALTANTWARHSMITTWGNDDESTLWNVVTASAVQTGSTLQIKNVVLTDLTAMFGSAVADYAYTLESATAGAGIAWLRKYGFFTKKYYPHSEPTFKHVEGLVSHKMVGFNQWSEDAEVGGINTANGQVQTDYQRIRSKNFIPCLPGTTYYTNLGVNMFQYDENQNFISFVWQAQGTFTTAANCHYLKFCTATNYGTTYKNDICINLSDPTKNGTYEPYKAYTYPLDPDVVLRGIPKLDANNNLYFDGDVYKADGTVRRRYDIITFDGTQTADNSSFSGTINNAIVRYVLPKVSTSGASDTFGDAMSDPSLQLVNRYAAGSFSTFGTSEAQKNGFGISIDGKKIVFGFSNSNLTSVADVNAYLAQHPITVVYEVATPTTETADPYAPLQLADPYGTEEWVLDADAFPMPVGQETFYPENLRAKIEGLPWNFANLIAPTEVSNVATRNYTAGNLLIVDNVLYKVTVNIANGGAITPGTNVTATTLAEIISALQ